MAIARDGDGDDMTSKTRDYLNVIFATNQILGHSIVFKTVKKLDKIEFEPKSTSNDIDINQQQSKPNVGSNVQASIDDNKQNMIENDMKTVPITDNPNIDKNNDTGVSHDDIDIDEKTGIDRINETNLNVLNYKKDKISATKYNKLEYKLFWNEEEINSFGDEIVEILSNKENGHDSLIMFIIWYGNNDDDLSRINDSKGNKINLRKFHEKIVSYMVITGDPLKPENNHEWWYPVLWFCDGYQHCKTKEEAINKNTESREKEIKIETGLGYMAFDNEETWTPIDRCYSIYNGINQGGILTQIAKSVFSSKKVAQGKIDMQDLISLMRDKRLQIMKSNGMMFFQTYTGRIMQRFFFKQKTMQQVD